MKLPFGDYGLKIPKNESLGIMRDILYAFCS